MRFNAFDLIAWVVLFFFLSISADAEVGDIIGPSESHHYDVMGGDTPEGKSVNKKLNSIILPRIDFKNQDIADVLKFLSNKSKELDPTHVGVQIHLEIPDAPKPKHFPVHREVNITLDDTCLAEVLAYICSQTNLGYRIIGSMVIMRPM